MGRNPAGGNAIPIVTAVVLQARLDSSRLPGKSLLQLGGKPLVSRVMEALNRVPAHLRVLACAPDCVTDFSPLAREAGFELFSGSKEDVLARYCDAARKFHITRIIRATGDNPFVFADAAAAINAEALALKADYAGYGGIPIGAGVESVNADALFRAESEAKNQYDREHVCPYLYGHPELFCLHRPLAPPRWQGAEIRLTIDTKDDYERAREIYAALEKSRNGEARYHGAEIVKTYREIFPEAYP